MAGGGEACGGFSYPEELTSEAGSSTGGTTSGSSLVSPADRDRRYYRSGGDASHRDHLGVISTKSWRACSVRLTIRQIVTPRTSIAP